MSKYLNDETRAMLLAFLPDIWTVAVLLGADVGASGQAAVSSLVTKAVVLLFYIVKTGQRPAT